MSVLSVIFSAWIGGILAFIAWKRSYIQGLANRYERVKAEVENARLGPRFIAFARWVHQNVVLPLVRFVVAVFEQVKHNISAPVPSEAVPLTVEGTEPKVENSANTAVEDPQPHRSGDTSDRAGSPRTFTQFCAMLISSLITSCLALACEAAKGIQYILAAKREPAGLLRMDLYDERDTGLTTIQLEAPGVSKEGMTISLFEGVLTVSCESTTSAEAPLGRFYHRRERAQGKLSRSIKVPAGTKAEDLRANMENGVLAITFPKESAHQPDKIRVE